MFLVGSLFYLREKSGSVVAKLLFYKRYIDSPLLYDEIISHEVYNIKITKIIHGEIVKSPKSL